VLYNLLEFAVEKSSSRLTAAASQWTAPKSSARWTRSCGQPDTSPDASPSCAGGQRSGDGCPPATRAPTTALRPEEAVNLRRQRDHPGSRAESGDGQDGTSRDDWGEFRLRRSAPHAGKDWTNNGTNRDDRGLKHRPDGAVRRVPIPPHLRRSFALTWTSSRPMESAGCSTANAGERSGHHLQRVWHRARAATFTEDLLASPLAATPYTLRHAAVSTWLNGGVPATKWRLGRALGRGAAQGLCQVPARQDLVARQRMADAVG